MADLIPQGQPSPQSDHKHEGEDLNLRGILIPAGCLVIIAITIHLGLWGLLTFFDAHRKPAEAALSPLARLPQEPPAPRLQNSPPLDLADFRTKENAELNGYRWQDRSAGRVLIPVERAKELFLKEYASRSESGASPTTSAPAPPLSSENGMTPTASAPARPLGSENEAPPTTSAPGPPIGSGGRSNE